MTSAYDTPLHAHLDAIGFPWRESRRELLARFGLASRGMRSEQVVAVPAARDLVDGMLWPLTTTCLPGDTLDQPFGHFATLVHRHDDARANFNATVDQMSHVLGSGEPGQCAHMLEHRWRFGRATLTVRARPDSPQTAPLHAASMSDPYAARRRQGASVELDTGYLAAPSAAEHAALAGFVPIAGLFDRSDARGGRRECGPPANQAHLVRDIDVGNSEYHGKVGTSVDGAWLIFSNHAHLYMIPMQDVLGLELLQLAPAQGPASAFLMLSSRRGQAQPLLLTITKRRAPAALSALACQLAEKLARPLLIHPVEAAC